jgi:hypothetical protein
MNEKRTAANRINSLRSTGPKSQAGKARSRLNALKHGAYAKVCLEDEDLTRYKALLLDLTAQYQPLGFEEKLLVSEIAKTIWRKNRFESAEALVINSYRYATIDGKEEKGDIGLALQQDAAGYGVIPSCLAAEEVLHRRLWNLFDRLRKAQKRRGFAPHNALAQNADRVIDVGDIGCGGENPSSRT